MVSTVFKRSTLTTEEALSQFQMALNLEETHTITIDRLNHKEHNKQVHRVNIAKTTKLTTQTENLTNTRDQCRLERCRQDTHSQQTSVQHSLFTSAERTPRAYLKSHGLQCHLCAPLMPFTTSTSSSSFTLPSTPTQEHAAQPVQHGHLQEHPVHHAHLQALPVDKQRHQESLWREYPQTGGNPRTTTSTGYEPKELATVSRIEHYPGGPYEFFDAQEKFGEQDHRAPITEEVKEFGEIRTAVCSHSFLDSQKSETSYFQSLMHFDDSVESIADSDLEDGELQKMLTSPLYAQKASVKPDAMVVQEREVSAQFVQAERKESLRSQLSEGQKALCKPNALFSSEQGNLIRSSAFRNANPSNLRGSLLEGKDHLLNQARSDLAKQELHVESLNMCIGEPQRYSTHNTDLLNQDENKFDDKKNCL